MHSNVDLWRDFRNSAILVVRSASLFLGDQSLLSLARGSMRNTRKNNSMEDSVVRGKISANNKLDFLNVMSFSYSYSRLSRLLKQISCCPDLMIPILIIFLRNLDIDP